MSLADQVRSNTVAQLVGTLLLVTASLKFFGLNVSAAPQLGFLLSPRFVAFVIGWELLLGLWLFSARERTLCWIATMTTFSCFAVAIAYFGIIGQATCGCLGMIKASPWSLFGLDLMVLAVVSVFRPVRDTNGAKTFLRQVGFVLIGSGVIVSALLAIGISWFGSVEASLAKLHGRAIAGQRFIDFGTAHPGQKIEKLVKLTNYSKEPVTLIGGTSDCTCVTTKELPLTIPPNNSVSVVIQLIAPNSDPGQFSRYAELMTNCVEQQKLRIVLTCVLAVD